MPRTCDICFVIAIADRQEDGSLSTPITADLPCPNQATHLVLRPHKAMVDKPADWRRATCAQHAAVIESNGARTIEIVRMN
jgi:hypothetical protein